MARKKQAQPGHNSAAASATANPSCSMTISSIVSPNSPTVRPRRSCGS